VNAAEFVNICQVAGYASKKNAKRYCEESGRDEFTDDDFSEVFKINERRNELKNTGTARIGSGYIFPGDYLIDSLGSYKPTPWNHIYDANRGKIGGE